MERESQSAAARLIARLGERLPEVNFYRFCQLLEQCDPGGPVPGSGWQVRHEPVRFRPHPGMGFPAGEIRNAEPGASAASPPTVRVTFMGLYGLASPLPSRYMDDISQRREGHEATQAFLDIFNHRLVAQFYRIWRKYAYPATFEAGGKDATSQYLLGLAGLGIRGCAESIATPPSRFLALLPLMLLPGRTAEGLVALVRQLTAETRAEVQPWDPARIPQREMLAVSTRQPVSLRHRPVMGSCATDVNGQVLLRLFTNSYSQARGWLPGGALYADLMALLHVYLGAKLDVRLQLSVARSLLPAAVLSCRTDDAVQLGRTAVMAALNPQHPPLQNLVTIYPGRYQRVRVNTNRKETDEDGEYRW